MATNGNAIATVGDIRTNFGVTLTSNDNYCPTYSSITANTRLGVSGATYSSNQLVMYKHIYKKTTEPMVTLTVIDWKQFMDSVGENDSDGVWMFSTQNNFSNILDGSYNSSYPTSNLYYFETEPTESECQIQGTAKQWQNLYNAVDPGGWDVLGLKNYESEKFIESIPNYDGLRRVVYYRLMTENDATVRFTTDSTGSTTGSTATTRNCTIPIYWKDYKNFGTIHCQAVITIRSNNGMSYSKTYQINNAYQGGDYVYLGDINITYTGTAFNGMVQANINFFDEGTNPETIITLIEEFDSSEVAISAAYTWSDTVFGDDASSFVQQSFELADAAATSVDYRLVLAFNY